MIMNKIGEKKEAGNNKRKKKKTKNFTKAKFYQVNKSKLIMLAVNC